MDSRLIFLALIACVAANSRPHDFVRTPGGWSIHKSCMFEVANGASLNMDEMPDCPYKAIAPEVQIYAIDTYVGTANAQVTQMNTSWVVPALPVDLSTQIVYFWPGFKSEQPVMNYPVLQPVLQYGQGKRAWMLQSWFVWGAKGISYTAPAIDINPGNGIDSYMLYNNTTTEWTCWAINKNDSKTSDLVLTSAKIQNTVFQYAMLVLETVMPASGYCNLYPGGDDKIVFTGVKVNNAAVAKWVPQVAETPCSQAVAVETNGDVQFSWKNSF